MILQNGKRLDGCSDTVPVGTLQPFAGLVPPKGYLICQGQLVNKTQYPQLYKVCGSLFGEETTTQFRLPDLRGKTIAGYDADNSLVNTIGRLLGADSHSHTTGNHTLTIEEMPTHYHDIVGSYNSNNGLNLATSNNGDGTTGYMSYSPVHPTGGSQPHNHGDTSVADNYQPTIVMNWIIKAIMLIPEYFIVENTLDSHDTQNALSANQGRLLNEKFADYITYSESLTNDQAIIDKFADYITRTESAAQHKTLNDKFADYVTHAELGDFVPDDFLSLSGGTLTGTLTMKHNVHPAINFREGSTGYDGCISYETDGNEALLFTTKNAVTSFMFINGEDIINNGSSGRWQSVTPGLQIKNNSVSIGKLIGNGASQTCKLHVEGKVNATSGFTSDDGVTTITAGHSNEINFGGTGTSDSIYFGYRGKDSRPKPTTFVFGSGSGTASVNAGKYYKDGVNVPCVWVQSSQPTAKQTGDIWIIP